LKKLIHVNVSYPFKFWVHESTWRNSKGCDFLIEFVNPKSLICAWKWEDNEKGLEGSLKPINRHAPCCGEASNW